MILKRRATWMMEQIVRVSDSRAQSHVMSGDFREHVAFPMTNVMMNIDHILPHFLCVKISPQTYLYHPHYKAELEQT